MKEKFIWNMSVNYRKTYFKFTLKKNNTFCNLELPSRLPCGEVYVLSQEIFKKVGNLLSGELYREVSLWWSLRIFFLEL